MRNRRIQRGFTLVELLVVVAVLGIISAIAVPRLTRALERARISRLAADLKTFETAFTDFALTTGAYPPDSHLEPPYHLANGIGLENYVPVKAWTQETPFGGHYNWEGPDFYPYAGISFFEIRATVDQMRRVDRLLDDGDLSTGAFRVTPNGRYTYILSE